ncbi:hypothetical protein P4403_04495 [Bacillus thuringiensis]
MAGESVLGRLSSVNGFPSLSVNFTLVKMFVVICFGPEFVFSAGALASFCSGLSVAILAAGFCFCSGLSVTVLVAGSCSGLSVTGLATGSCACLLVSCLVPSSLEPV